MKNKIKSLLASRGFGFVDFAKYLEITPQALQSKFNKKTYKAKDLILLAELTNYRLVMIDDKGNIKEEFTKEDIKKSNQ